MVILAELAEVCIYELINGVLLGIFDSISVVTRIIGYLSWLNNLHIVIGLAHHRLLAVQLSLISVLKIPKRWQSCGCRLLLILMLCTCLTLKITSLHVKLSLIIYV